MTEENTRLVVAGSQYLVRYLTMTLRQGLEHSRGIENFIYFPSHLEENIFFRSNSFEPCHQPVCYVSPLH